jgi:hypothetical protein
MHAHHLSFGTTCTGSAKSAIKTRDVMKLSTMPYAVQLRELHRQELYVEADHERLVRDAALMKPRPQRDLFGLRGRVAAMCTWMRDQRCQRCPVTIDQRRHRPFCTG